MSSSWDADVENKFAPAFPTPPVVATFARLIPWRKSLSMQVFVGIFTLDKPSHCIIIVFEAAAAVVVVV